MKPESQCASKCSHSELRLLYTGTVFSYDLFAISQYIFSAVFVMSTFTQSEYNIFLNFRTANNQLTITNQHQPITYCRLDILSQLLMTLVDLIVFLITLFIGERMSSLGRPLCSHRQLHGIYWWTEAFVRILKNKFGHWLIKINNLIIIELIKFLSCD